MADIDKKPLIGVIGAGQCGEAIRKEAFQVGRLIAKSGFGLVNGGLGGVMEASAEGCISESGLTVGILPGLEASSANPFMEVVLPTGLGDMRNLLIVRASAVLIAIGGRLGTLSEAALALKSGKPVVGFHSWDVIIKLRAHSPEEAVNMAITAIEKSA